MRIERDVDKDDARDQHDAHKVYPRRHVGSHIHDVCHPFFGLHPPRSRFNESRAKLADDNLGRSLERKYGTAAKISGKRLHAMCRTWHPVAL